jgi:hypothetical protein
VSRMLVAYESCGCRAMELINPKAAEDEARFIRDVKADGLTVGEEEHEEFITRPCPTHSERVDAETRVRA